MAAAVGLNAGCTGVLDWALVATLTPSTACAPITPTRPSTVSEPVSWAARRVRGRWTARPLTARRVPGRGTRGPAARGGPERHDGALAEVRGDHLRAREDDAEPVTGPA